jgi:sulfotransferase family protein
MPDNAPIFIVSAPRSGSTLLRLILNTHSRIDVPPPGWLFDMVYPYLYSYGDLNSDANLTSLAEDVLHTPTVKKWGLSIAAKDLVERASEASFKGLLSALHELHMESKGKRRWGEKTPRHGFWMDEIHALYPDAQFIHIVRDGRDMAIDISDSILLPYSVYSGAALWQRYVSAIRDSASRLDARHYLEVRYEDLCAQPEQAIGKICDYLQEGFEPAMLAPNKTNSAQNWSGHPLHAKTAQPISTKYCQMYRTRITADDTAALEGLIGTTLQAFGYPLSGRAKQVPPRLASQFLESDAVTNPENVEYKKWHDERRKARREGGVWKDAERTSFLWGMN